MEWIHVITILVGNAAVFLPIFFWMRTEANADRREIQSEMSDFRKEMSDLRKETLNMINEIKLENKDFHYRLLEIERNRNK